MLPGAVQSTSGANTAADDELVDLDANSVVVLEKASAAENDTLSREQQLEWAAELVKRKHARGKFASVCSSYIAAVRESQTRLGYRIGLSSQAFIFFILFQIKV